MPLPSRQILLRALALLAAGSLPRAAAAGLLRVPQDHPTIQAAVEASLPGDEIRIARGTYAEAVTLSGKTGLLIRGRGAVLDPGGGALALTLVGCSDVVIEGLHLRNTPDWPLVDCLGGSNLVFRRLRCTQGNYAVYAGGVDGLVIERSRFQDLTGPALTSEGTDEVLFSRNRVLRCYRALDGSQGQGLRIERLAAVQVQDTGIDLGFSGPVDDVILERVRLADTGDGAISILGDRARIDRVRVVRGGDYGLRLSGADALVERLVVSRTQDHDALDVAGEGMRVADVRLVRTGGGACFRGAGGEVRDLRVLRPAGDGLVFEDFTAGLVEDGLVVRPEDEGVVVEDGEDSVFRNLAVRGTQDQPEPDEPGPALLDSDGPAAFVLEGARHLVEGCTSAKAGGSGFVVDGEQLTLVGNTATGAGGHGFEVRTGGHLFQRNTASGSQLFDLQDEQPEGASVYEDNDFGTAAFGARS